MYHSVKISCIYLCCLMHIAFSGSCALGQKSARVQGGGIQIGGLTTNNITPAMTDSYNYNLTTTSYAVGAGSAQINDSGYFANVAGSSAAFASDSGSTASAATSGNGLLTLETDPGYTVGTNGGTNVLGRSTSTLSPPPTGATYAQVAVLYASGQGGQFFGASGSVVRAAVISTASIGNANLTAVDLATGTTVTSNNLTNIRFGDDGATAAGLVFLGIPNPNLLSTINVLPTGLAQNGDDLSIAGSAASAVYSWYVPVPTSSSSSISLSSSVGPMFGDFNASNSVDAADIDLLTSYHRNSLEPLGISSVYASPVSGQYALPLFDINVDTEITIDYSPTGMDSDLTQLIRGDLGTEFGDANLDGSVDDLDEAILFSNAFTYGGWADGDFDGSGFIDPEDLDIFEEHYGYGASTSQATAVPEPSAICFVILSSIVMLMRNRLRPLNSRC